MRLGYVLKYVNHSTFDGKHIWAGLWDGLKEKRILSLSPGLIHLYYDYETWNDNLGALQLLNRWDNSQFDPKIEIKLWDRKLWTKFLGS